jgi:putative folate metabolism gamma-glutamate ligase
MRVHAIATHRIEGAQSILPLLDRYITVLEEEMVVAVSSKIVSVCEGRVVARSSISKKALVWREADAILEEERPDNIYLTIKNNILIPTAGIDESNTDGEHYVLYPLDPFKSARVMWNHLRQRRALKSVGVLVVDSHTTPLRRGVTGIGLSWCGFAPLYNCIGKPDLYGHPFRFTYVNIVDALSAAAALVMGESNECTPLVTIQEVAKINYSDTPPTPDERKLFSIPPTEDLYSPLLNSFTFLPRKD